MTLAPTQAELLRHIADATEAWARSGRPSRTFLLLHLGGLQSTIDHPGWDSSWPTPSEHDIDDLAELGLLRVEPSFNKQRKFVLSVRGARVAADIQTTTTDPGLNEPDAASDDSGADQPSAFVSWAHDDPTWEATVYTFVRGLYANGIEAEIDLFHLSDPLINWADYGAQAIESSDYVLIAANAKYRRRWDGTEDPTTGAGAAYEANTLKSIFASDRNEFQRKVKVIVLPGASENDIPLPIRASCQRFTIDPRSSASFEGLVRMLTGQNAFGRPPLAPIPELPPGVAEASAEAVTSDEEAELVAFINELRDSLKELRNGYLGAQQAHLYGVVLSKVKNARPGNELVAGLSEPKQTAMSGVYRPTAPEARAALNAMRAALVGSNPAEIPLAPVEPELDPTLLRGRIFPNSFASSASASETVLVIRGAIAGQLPVAPAPTIDSVDEQAVQDLVAGSSLEAWAQHATTAAGDRWRAVDPTSSYVVTLRRPPASSVVEGWEIECRAFVTVAPNHALQAVGHGILLLDVLFRPRGEGPPPPLLTLQDLFELMFVLPAALVDQVGKSLFQRLSSGVSSEVMSASVVVQSYGWPLGGFVKLVQDGWNRAEGSHDRQGAEWEPTTYLDLVSPGRRAAALRAWLKKLARDSGIRGHEPDIDAMPTPEMPTLD